MTKEEFEAMVLAMPGVERASAYGHPGFKAFGKFLTRLRSEDNSLVLRVSFDEREMLMEAEPETFHLTPHYQNYPSVLARLDKLDAATVKSFLERSWRQAAPKKFLKEYDAGKA
jgi:hypothetical protein